MGYISVKNFELILKKLRQYQLSELISSHVQEIVKLSTPAGSTSQVSYPYLAAFLQLLSNIEAMRKIYLSIHEKKTHAYKSPTITKEEFLNEAQHSPRTTPLQIDILFAILRILHEKNSGHEIKNDYIELNDFDLISAKEHLLPYRLRSEVVDEVYKVEHQSVTMKLLESGYRFALGNSLLQMNILFL